MAINSRADWGLGAAATPADLKTLLVASHRILTRTGSMGDITGHVMARVPRSDEMLVRCRNMEDVGPALVETTAFFRCDLDGHALEDTGDYELPPERFMASEIFKARPDIHAVAHGHPPAQIRCSITGVRLRPIIGCGNTGGMLLALDGIDVYERSILVASAHIGNDVATLLGQRNVLLLKGHGNVVCGRSIEEATVRAIQVENLAQVCWDVAAAGLHADDISSEDIKEFLAPSQEGVRGDIPLTQWMWAHYHRALREDLPLYAEMGVLR